MDAPTVVAIVASALGNVVLTIRHLVARRNPSCDYRCNQLRLRIERNDQRIDELEATVLRTAAEVQKLHRDVAILKRAKESV